MKRALLFFLCLFISARAGVLDHLKKIEGKTGSTPIEGIGCLYLINLDERPEKLERSQSELARYELSPQRFSAIYGWSLPPGVLDDIGLVFQHGMWTGREAALLCQPSGEFSLRCLDGSCNGKTCFSYWISKGAIGCTLSHLSVLKDAFDAGYPAAWVLEDDIIAAQDPRKMSAYIEELSSIAGEDGWDLLYTDAPYLTGIDLGGDILKQLPWMWRPDMPFFDLRQIATSCDSGSFVKIGSRIRAHSLIVSRAGMKKILGFYETHGIFMPYDHELFFIPDIRAYAIKENVVTAFETTSDTRGHHFK